MSHRVLWLVTGVAGAGIILLTLVVGLVMLGLTLGSLLTGEITSLLFSGSVVAAGVGLGTLLVILGWSGWWEKPSRPFYPRLRWRMWIGLVLLIVVGDVLARASGAARVLLVPIHVLAMSAPALITLVLVTRGLRRSVSSWREVGLALTSGGLIGTVLSLIAEGIVVLVILFVVVFLLAQTPGGMEWLSALSDRVTDPAWVSDPGQLIDLFVSPGVALLAVAVVSIPVPLIEEAFKTLGIGILGRWYRPGPAYGFLWGVASGAGFALVENLLNGAVSSGSGWGQVVLARSIATVMHCFAGGIVGWGWAQLWTERRPLILLGCYLAAVGIHGLWNGVVAVVALLSVAAEVYQGDVTWVRYAPVAIALLVGVLGALCITFLVAMLVIGRCLSAEPGQTASTSGAVVPQEL